MRGPRLLLLSAILALLPVAASAQALVKDVRAAIARNDLPGADALVVQYRTQSGTTSEALAAMSWLGRGALAARQDDKADLRARHREELTLRRSKPSPSPTRTWPRPSGVSRSKCRQRCWQNRPAGKQCQFLQDQIVKYRSTPIDMRLTKNLNLISLEGQPAPKLTAKEFLGPAMPDMKGHAVVLFFWAHWCPDCKAQAPISLNSSATTVAAGCWWLAPPGTMVRRWRRCGDSGSGTCP